MNIRHAKVSSVEKLSEKQDVYDITVDGNHNMFANGVLTHNCNLYITFKVRDNKLHMMVTNRSNDIIYGIFGANIVQFSTIQETLCSWLRNSGNDDFKDLQVGTYHQVTDSMHSYLDSYGSSAAEKVLDYYKDHEYVEPIFNFSEEPRINSSYEKFQESLDFYWNNLDKYIVTDNLPDKDINKFINTVSMRARQGYLDEYVAFTVKSMMAYRLLKQHDFDNTFIILWLLPSCQWKVSMMYFVKKFIENIKDENEKKTCTYRYNSIVDDLVFHLLDKGSKKQLEDYLTIK